MLPESPASATQRGVRHLGLGCRHRLGDGIDGDAAELTGPEVVF